MKKIKNTASEVNKRIDEMQKRKKRELDALTTKEAETNKQLAAVEEEIKSATTEMNAEEYGAARSKKAKLELTLEMISDKRKQIKNGEYVTEEESNSAIDDLLYYERQLETAFKEKMKDLKGQLSDLYNEYTGAVKETERVINRWTKEIHANYRSESAQVRVKHPVPVHAVPYQGCGEAIRLGRYLGKEEQLENQPQ